MNLHQLQIQKRWAEAHILRHPNRCSECPGVTIDQAETHLREEHLRQQITWVCECSDIHQHPEEGMCETLMGSEDANIDGTRDPYTGTVLNWDFPYIYVCPDCREHNHQRRMRTQ